MRLWRPPFFWKKIMVRFVTKHGILIPVRRSAEAAEGKPGLYGTGGSIRSCGQLGREEYLARCQVVIENNGYGPGA